MRALLLIVWAGLRVLAQTPSTPPQNPGPLYAVSSIVNAANPKAAQLAPGTLATLYGSHLAFTSRAVTADDVRSGMLPTALPGTGVRVLVGSSQAPLLYVSPNQINFLVPSEIGTGPTDVRVTLDARAGPAVRIMLGETSPTLFHADPEFAVAVWQDDVVILYATGLGPVVPPLASGQLAKSAAPIEKLGAFRVEIGGIELAPEAIIYAGAAPGFAGLYQINVRVPGGISADPEVRIAIGESKSPAGVKIRNPR